jgi:hypothetical protein
VHVAAAVTGVVGALYLVCLATALATLLGAAMGARGPELAVR